MIYMSVFDPIIKYILSFYNLTYTHYYATSLAITNFFSALIIMLIAFLLKIISKRFKTINHKRVTEIELQFSQPSQDQKPELTHLLPSSEVTEMKTFPGSITLQKFVPFSYLILFVFSILIGGTVPAILSGVDIIKLSTSVEILLAFFCFIFLCFASQKADETIPRQLDEEIGSLFVRTFSKSNFCQKIHLIVKNNPVLTMFYFAFSLVYSLSIPISLSGLCLAYYNPNAGFEYGPFWASTYTTRYFSQPSVCPINQICHIYSTLPEDSSSAVIINVHTGINIEMVDVLYHKTAEDNTTNFLVESKKAQSYLIDFEAKAARYVHSAYLTKLEPGTKYYVQIIHDNEVKGEAYFSTLPNENMESNITIALGGDVGGSPIAAEVTKQLGNFNPDVIILGGDLSYDNGNTYCWYTWDLFLDLFQTLNQRMQRLVPLILAVGNHDIGQNQYQFIQFDKEKSPLFLYFPQHSKTNKDGDILFEVPNPKEREAYFYHKIGKTLHITLDSGYLNEYDGRQLEWLLEVSKTYPEMPKYAHYHLPIVPACYFGVGSFDKRVLTWAKVFEKHKFIGVFENHMHLYKRTLPLRFGNETDHGVVYFGDGNWGVNYERCYDRDTDKNRTGVFASFGKVNHAWVMKVKNRSAEYFPINATGHIFDEVFVQTFNQIKNSKK